MDILTFNPFRKLNRGAFSGKEMNCPYCSKHVDPNTSPIGFETDKQKVKLWDRLGPFIREYRCMHCGGIWRYDVKRKMLHPYSSFKRGLDKRPSYPYKGNVEIPGLKYSGRVPLLNG